MPVEGGVRSSVPAGPVKQEPAGHATAWRKHWTPRTGALTTVDDAPASHLNREGGSTHLNREGGPPRADRGAGRSWAPGCPPSSETTRAATPTRRPYALLRQGADRPCLRYVLHPGRA